MADPVNLADVLADHCGHPQWCVWIEGESRGSHLRDAVLAYGGGDPVVVETDGILYRGKRVTLWRADRFPGVLRLDTPTDTDDWERVQAVIHTDPVTPDA